MNEADSDKQDCANKPMKRKQFVDNVKTSLSGKKVRKVWRLKKDSVVKHYDEEPFVVLNGNEAEKGPVRNDIPEQRNSASDANLSGNIDTPPQLSRSVLPSSNNAKSGSRWRLKHSAGPCNPPSNQSTSLSPSSKPRKAVVVPNRNKRHRIPLRWWFGFCRSYEDGRTGEEGRFCHVLSEFEFDGAYPENWYSDVPLSDWEGIDLHSGIVCINCLDISR